MGLCGSAAGSFECKAMAGTRDYRGRVRSGSPLPMEWRQDLPTPHTWVLETSPWCKPAGSTYD
ncbi:hypothetical protein Tter_0524 [Thermobaculum terrenum ATCC BAA-798]|uniref:Uncharacterized protein n=1 Tax=Thermobaculum terrenum (strain ATCC BAA-798 / CCMEE 7001 / YNP1) TaxID=525904 RepID=D1CET7_THET1|nr:hypothetical protein [Thermobaculum terrenum]ACZ41443.1 hypothetical protein Tter_0524 [Thermobaculum terrenum ATCC BAA-798]